MSVRRPATDSAGPRAIAHIGAAWAMQLTARVTSSIIADTALADTIHALAQLGRGPHDRTFVRDRLAAMDAALSQFESTLAHPLAELGPDVHRAYLAALALACTLTHVPPAEAASMRRTMLRLLDLLDALAAPADRALRARLLNEPSWVAQASALA